MAQRMLTFRPKPAKVRGFVSVQGFALALAIGALAVSTPARAADPFLTVLPAAEALSSPAQRHAKLSKPEAFEALRKRGVAFSEVPPSEAPGVLMPVRLSGPVGGIWFRSGEPEGVRRRSRYEILDARLALTLADWAELLRHHDVEEVRHFSLYRPDLPPGPKRGKAARRPAPVPSAGQSTSRHPAGLAIDVAAFKKRDGSWLRVADQFFGHIGARTCGAGAPRPASSGARELRSIVCEAADAKVFTYVLTPNYNAAHRDHFHMEVKGGVPWVLTHLTPARGPPNPTFGEIVTMNKNLFALVAVALSVALAAACGGSSSTPSDPSTAATDAAASAAPADAGAAASAAAPAAPAASAAAPK